MQKLEYLLLGLLTVHSAWALPDQAPTAQEEPSTRGPALVGHRVSVKPLDLSRAPATDELMAAGQLGGPLFPTHELKDGRRDEAARWAFGRAIEQWNQHEYGKAVGMFRKYVAEYPDSPWAAEAELHIGCDASYNGRYTEADELFNKLITDHQGKEHPGAKMLRNKARQRLALLKVAQNNLEAAGLHFQLLLQDSPDWRHRTYASHWIQRLSRYAAAKNALVNCGAEALAYALEKEGRHAAALQVRTNLPPTMNGHSLASLAGLAADRGFELAALQVAPADLHRLPLPAILRIAPQPGGDKGHYWVLDKVEGQKVELFDPQSERRFRQSTEELAREWNGQALVFAKDRSLPGRRLTLSEMEAACGGCCGVPAKEDHQGDPCGNGAGGSEGGCTSCSEGAPRWTVNMVNMNVFMTDTPMWYSPPIGPPVRISLSYNSQSAIAQNEPFGNKWQFNYASYLVVDTADTVTLFMPDGRRDTFDPDGFGGYVKPYQVHNTLTKLGPNWFTLRFLDDTVYTYQIPPGSRSQQPMLVEIRDAWGQRLSFGYDDLVRLNTITDAQGLVTRLTYNADDLVVRVADPFGRTASFAYDGSRSLTKITDMGGYWSSFTYDANVYLTSLGNERGTWNFLIEPADGVSNGSDPYPPPGSGMWENYRATVTDPLGQSWEYHYNGYSSYAWKVSPRDYTPWRSQYENNSSASVQKTTYYYTQMNSGRQGALHQIVYPEGDYVQYGYNTLTGDRTSKTDAHGHTWRYTYNSRGQITSIRDPKGVSTTLSYAANGVDLLSISDGLGPIRMTYTPEHGLASTTDRLGNATTFTYNNFGQILSQVDKLGTTTEYLYDASQHLTEVRRAGRSVGRFTYEAMGRMRSRSGATGLTVINEYNNLDKLVRATYPDGRFVSYDYSTCCPDLLDSVTDRGGQTTLFIHDALKRLVQTVSPEGGITRSSYDANGNVTSLTDPSGNVTTFGYDLDNRLVRRTYADGKGLSFRYDSAGLLAARTNARGATVTYNYDASHNLLGKAYSDGTPGLTNTFDAFDRLTVVKDGLGTHAYTYDADSRITSADGPWLDDTVTYAYDALGRPTQLAVQGSQPTSYEYDALNRLTDVRVGAQTYAYTYSGANPLIQRLDRPNGSFTTYQYDGLNRPTSLSNRRSTGEVINEFLYAYNAQDLRSSETISNGLAISLPNKGVVRYGYDPLNQMQTSTPSARLFAYDSDGNMTRGYTPAGYVFAAAYDAENRITSLGYTNASGVACRTEYSYCGGSQLAQVKAFTNGVLSQDLRFVVNGFVTLQDRDGRDNSVLREYAWGSNRRGGIGGCLHLTAAGVNYSYLYDGKGNVATVIKGDQTPAASYGYGVFGELATTAGSLNQPLRFSTKRYDEGNGLSYFGNRFYASSVGRWMTRDPIGERGGLNLYGFVGNNPISRFDPWGLWTWVPWPWPDGGYTIMVTAEEVAAASARLGHEVDPDGLAWHYYMEYMQSVRQCAQEVSPEDVAATFQKIEDTAVKVAPAAPVAAATAWETITSAAAIAAAAVADAAIVAAEALTDMLGFLMSSAQMPSTPPGGPGA